MDAVFSRLTGVFDRIAAITDRPRTLGFLIGAPTTIVLAIAAWLTPAAQGFGTHMQLGLGGCAMLTMTGWPCPMCGMTTTFALMAHFRLMEALVNQPFGVVLFALTVIGSVLGIADMVTGRGIIRAAFRWVGRREQLLALGLLFGMIGGWIYKSMRMHPGLFD
ncbi:MAG: DUF2752 domain-containing protein [Pseudomonadota bacterium]|nr:DUF2752 domain-containing protein [Pseudomonadota bacterium]